MLSTTPSTPADIQTIRAQFPALDRDLAFLENAGGSQVPAIVADAVRDYMLDSYVQLGAGYALSDLATKTVDDAHAWIERFMNAGTSGRVVLGPSCTALCNMLAAAYEPLIEPDDEIVIATCGHEANIGPWVRLAKKTGCNIVWWNPDDRESSPTTVAKLEKLLTTKSKLVILPHVSNLLGEIIDVAAVTQVAHAIGAKVVVDGVAYAPHRAIDCERWQVDWYLYSTYKVYGPHMAAMYGSHDALSEVTGPNHFFIDDDDVPYKFEPGGVSHEGCAGLLVLQMYLKTLIGNDTEQPCTFTDVQRAFDRMTELELPLQAKLIDFLKSREDVRIIGPAHGSDSRVGTISVVHCRKSSSEIVNFVSENNIAIRFGHMYAYRLCEFLDIEPEAGVVRVSLVHYNTMAEIDRLIAVLDACL